MDSIRLLTIVLFLVFAASGATSPMLSLYLQALGADYAHISAILTTYAVAALAASYAWGRLSDRLGRRKPLVVGGLWGGALAFGLLAAAPTATFAWGVRVFEAVAMTAYGTVSLAFMGDLLANNPARGRRMGSYRGFGSLSFALGAFGGGSIIQFLGMRQALALCALFLAAAAAVAMTIREAAPADPPPTTAASTAPTRPQRMPFLFLLGVLLWTGAFWAAYSMWPNYLRDLGYPESAANWLWGLAAISEVPFMSVVGLLSDALGRAPVLAMGGLGVGLVLLGYVTLNRWLAGLMAVQVFRGFAYSAFTATSMIYATESGTARTRAGSVGVYNVAMALGQILGLAVGGQIVQRAGFTTLFLASALVFAASAAVFSTLHGQQAWKQATA
jgi:MFS family permease